jgi:hypothetical protein
MSPTTPSAPDSGSGSTSAEKTPSTTAKSTSAKPTATKTPRAKPAAKRASTASRKPSDRIATETTTAKRTSTAAGNARAKAAKATKTEVKTGVKLVETYAERAVLVPVGAALAAREMIAQTVGELIDTYGSTKKTEAQLKRFERRGVTARNQLEREAKKARKRVEDALHKRRTDVEKAVSHFDRRRHDVERRVTDQVGDVTAKIDDTIRQAADAGVGLVDKARDAVDSIV